MRRIGIAVLLGAALVVAVVSYRLANRPMVVGRANLGEPPPPPAPRKNAQLVGHRIPQFGAIDLDGKRVGTDALHGRVVVLDVWATWCLPCVDEMPRFEEEIHRRFGSEVIVVAIAVGEDEAKVRRFKIDHELTFSLVPDPSARIATLLGGKDLIPRTYVVDRSGMVTYQKIGYNPDTFGELGEEVARVVAERSTSS